jgi:glycyl-tRNA synthetase beta chain
VPSLLLEIGCEELPAAACVEAGLQLPELAREHLGVVPDELYIGPRRLAFPARVPERTADEWVKGPPEALRERAAAGFAKRHGASVDDLTVRDGFLGLDVPGRPIAEELPQRLAAIVRGLQFGKSMTWGVGFRFARPVRWLLAKLDDATIEVALEGVPSGSVSYGHRSTHPAPVEVASAGDYLGALRAAGVEPDRAVRYEQIVAGLDALGPWSDPLGKLDEVVYLVELARVLEGSFDERFLRLPQRVIVTTMQSHQRYFPLGGNRFAFVTNGGDPDVVRAGNEFVLSGRLEDAEFTFERDVAVGIDGLAERLSSTSRCASSSSCASWVEATPPRRRRGSRRPTRPRSSCASSPSSRGTSARRTRSSRATPTRSCARSTSSTSPTAPAGRCPARTQARCSRRPTRSTRCASRSASASARPAHVTRSDCGGRRSA